MAGSISLEAQAQNTLLSHICVFQNINIFNHKKFLNTINSKSERNVYCCILPFTFEKFLPKDRRGSKAIMQLVLFY